MFPTDSGNLQISRNRRDLNAYLAHLPVYQMLSIVKLINNHPNMFSNVPSRTNVLTNDIDIGDASPIKQYPYRVNPHKCSIMKAEFDS